MNRPFNPPQMPLPMPQQQVVPPMPPAPGQQGFPQPMPPINFPPQFPQARPILVEPLIPADPIKLEDPNTPGPFARPPGVPPPIVTFPPRG